MINLTLFGAKGRMGSLIQAEAGGDTAVVQCIDATDPLRLDASSDAVVDFSLASAWNSLDELLHGTSVPLVSGTTGLKKPQLELLEKWSCERPVFYSANMSVGVFVLHKLMKRAEELLDESWDRELIEFHHNRKLDSPSGTALSLLENWPGNAPAHSIRGGDVTGEHHLYYMGQGERLVLSHIATDRRVFALGALKAVRYLSGLREPGLYGMEDMLEQDS